jgi:hypothetical protein
LNLESVRTPTKEKIIIIKQNNNNDKVNHVFEDNLIKIDFFFYRDIEYMKEKSRLFFTLENKSNYPIKIIWDEISFVDQNGENHKMIHNGIKFIDAEKHQVPTVILGKSKISDSLIPSDNIYYSDLFSEWQYKLIDIQEDNNLQKAAKQISGKTVKLLLPIEINNTIYKYIFIFKIDDVKVASKTNSI